MQKTSKLEMNLFEDSDIFHVNDLKDNIDTINHTAPQKSTPVLLPNYTQSVAKWAYWDSNMYPVHKSTNITWNVGKFLGDRYVIFQSIVCDDVMLLSLGDGYGPFATEWGSAIMELRIYMPSVFSETDQITNVQIVPMCSTAPVWLTSINIGTDSGGLYVKPVIMAPKVDLSGVTLDKSNRLTISFNVYAEIRGSGYDGTLGMESISPTTNIWPNQFNNLFTGVGSDIRSSTKSSYYLSTIDSGCLVYGSDYISGNLSWGQTRLDVFLSVYNDCRRYSEGMLYYISQPSSKKGPYISVDQINSNGTVRLRGTYFDGEYNSNYYGRLGFIKYRRE